MKTKIVLIVSIVLFFAAGMALGLLLSRPNQPPPPPPRHGEGQIEEQLHLTPVQREQMRKIWFDAMAGARQGDDERTAINTQRDQKIQALLSQEQLARYEELQQDYHRKMEELSQARRRATEQAVDEQTRKILTPEQITKYDELMKELRQHGPGSRPDGMGGMGGPEGRPGRISRRA